MMTSLFQLITFVIINFYTAPSNSTASWHGLYKPLDLQEGERRIKLLSYLLFYNTLYSNTHARILSVMFIAFPVNIQWSVVAQPSEIGLDYLCQSALLSIIKHKSIFYFSLPLSHNY